MIQTLKNIIDVYGLDILKDGNKLLAYYADLSPKQQRERQMLEYFVKCNGHITLLNALHDTNDEQIRKMKLLVERMVAQFLIPEDIAETVCQNFWKAIGGTPIVLRQPKLRHNNWVKPAAIVAVIAVAIGIVARWTGENDNNSQTHNSASNQFRQAQMQQQQNQPVQPIGTEPYKSAVETTHSHTWSAWDESIEANCEQSGVETRRCASCGEMEERNVPKTEHNWAAATWHSPSYCSLCGAVQGTAMISVGDTVTFGRYEQDNNLANGNESIQWRVLSIQGNQALLISSNALDAQPYHTDYVNTTWETSYLRQWLNSSFLRAAFNNIEEKAIVETAISNDSNQGNSKYTTSGGNTTNDRVFLLSYAEIMEYLPDSYSRACMNTAYAASQAGKNVPGSFNSSVRTCWWWLRSPGDTLCAATTVFPDRENTIDAVNNASGCVRPAIWVDINTPDLNI